MLPTLAPAARGDLRLIPKTGEAVPVIGMGTWITFNVGDDPVLIDRSKKVTRIFFEEGGGVIDSSPMYGSSQDTIGYALEALAPAETLFSADKVWTRGKRDGVRQIEETRTKWGVPNFDLLQVHNLVDWKAHLETLYAMKDEGRLRYVGITTSHGRRHSELEAIMASEPIDFVQLTYNVVDRQVENRLLPLAQERGIGVIVNRPYQRGALINRFEGKPLPGIAADLGATTWAEVLMKFVISHPAVTVAIPATTKPEHMAENKRAARTPLPDEAGRKEIAAYVASL
ncbi:MAG: aldo/keto reductase [Pseudomonadota bacterium]